MSVCINREGELRGTGSQPSCLGRVQRTESRRAGGPCAHTQSLSRVAAKLCSGFRNWPNVLNSSPHCTTLVPSLLGVLPPEVSLIYNESTVWHPHTVNNAGRQGYPDVWVIPAMGRWTVSCWPRKTSTHDTEIPGS